jgi:uncharacterized protein YecT (DUF1311 family)
MRVIMVMLAFLSIIPVCKAQSASQSPAAASSASTKAKAQIPVDAEEWMLGSMTVGVYSRPAVDCGKAKGAPARLICNDNELARADYHVNSLFNDSLEHFAVSARGSMKKERVSWLRTRNQKCGLDDNKANAPLDVLMLAKPCMMAAMRERAVSYGLDLNTKLVARFIQIAG